MKIYSIKDLRLGVRRHPWKSAGYTFTAFSVLFTLITGISYFVPGVQIQGWYAFGAVILASIAFAMGKVWKPSKVEVRIRNADTVIELLFGDLFAQEGLRAIAVTDFFDSKIGKPVSENSLHGILLKECFGGHSASFDKMIDQQLHGVPSVDTDKVEGKIRRFPIGTTAVINVNEEKYILFALAKADTQTCKAQANVTMMWGAINKVWERARIEAGGNPVNLPLVGSGLSGLGLPTRDLLNLIILSAITETKSRPITHRIRVVLHRSRFDEIDLREVKSHWEE